MKLIMENWRSFESETAKVEEGDLFFASKLFLESFFCRDFANHEILKITSATTFSDFIKEDFVDLIPQLVDQGNSKILSESLRNRARSCLDKFCDIHTEAKNYKVTETMLAEGVFSWLKSKVTKFFNPFMSVINSIKSLRSTMEAFEREVELSKEGNEEEKERLQKKMQALQDEWEKKANDAKEMFDSSVKSFNRIKRFFFKSKMAYNYVVRKVCFIFSWATGIISTAIGVAAGYTLATTALNIGFVAIPFFAITFGFIALILDELFLGADFVDNPKDIILKLPRMAVALTNGLWSIYKDKKRENQDMQIIINNLQDFKGLLDEVKKGSEI